MRAICNSCGRDICVDGTRGARLADQRCRYCGGTLRGKTSGIPNKNAGRKYQVCGSCGRRGLGLVTPEADFLVWYDKPMKAGTPVHRWHIVDQESLMRRQSQ